MTAILFRTLQHCAAAALLATLVAACSTAPGDKQALSSEGHIRSWADWATVPGGIPPQNALISNRGEGN